MKRTLVLIGGLTAVAIGGCGGGGGETPPAAPHPATPAQAPAAITADPCTALHGAQLNAYLAGGPQQPHRADRGADRVCQWGDGEFRLVELTLTREPARGRPIPVGTRTGSTGAADDYGCTVALTTPHGTARLQTVTPDKGAARCPATATTLAAAVTALGW